MLPAQLPDFVPGRLALRTGDSADYRVLAPFHYCARKPATWAAVLCITHSMHDGDEPRIVGVGVLSWPTAVSRPRREVFGLGEGYAQQVRFANGQVRTISRVIVHPQFRGVGLARLLIQKLREVCPTRYIEATAAMAAAHPMFERAGMKRHDRADGGAAYFWARAGAQASAGG